MKLRIATKFAALAFSTGLVMLLTLGILSIGENRSIVTQGGDDNCKKILNKQVQEFESQIQSLTDDVWLLGTSPSMRQLISLQKPEQDEEDDNTKVARTSLAELFKNRMKRNKEYFQVRYINQDGFEVVRIERDKHTGEPILKPGNFRRTRSYFEKVERVVGGLKDNQSSVFLSEIELNREIRNGQEVVDANLPVVRASMPVFHTVRGWEGFVIINMDVRPLTRKLKKVNEELDDQAKLDRHLYLVNSDGDYLIHPDPKLQYQFPNTPETDRRRLQHDFPQLTTFFSSSEEEYTEPSTPQESHFHLRRISGFDKRYPERFLVIALETPHEHIMAEANRFQRAIVFGGTVLLLVSLLIVFFVARFLTRPLAAITDATERLADGDFDVNLPLDAHDEIGVLANSFQTMVGQLKERGEELLDREARTRAIVDTAAEGIITLQNDGIIESANQAAEKIFGYQTSELDDQSITQLMDWPNPGGDDLNGQRQGGITFPMELAVSKLAVGKSFIYTLIVRDITERKNSEQEILALNRDLDQRVQDRTRELESAVHELSATNAELDSARDQTERANFELQNEVAERKLAEEQANRASEFKSQFLANMSHELRTPLNAVIGYSEMLIEDAEDDGQEQTIPDLERIRSAGKHLLALINDILDLSKIEAGKVELEFGDFELCTMVEETAATVRPAVERKGSQLVVEMEDDLGEIRSDITRLRQCLYNLLSNAGKFTENGKVTLAVSRDHRDGTDWLRFAIRDTGIGMNEEQISRLFQAFSQADVSTTRMYGGTGLGLAISKKLAILMGGDITVSSKVGEGSTFELEFPINKSRQATESDPPQLDALAKEHIANSTVPRPGNNIVLVVDDDESVREMMQRYLESEGFRVVTVTNANDVVKTAKQVQPQAITLDVMMPERDGWTVMSDLKDDPETAGIPVIMVTIVDDKNMGMAMGAADYLTKPIDRNRLLAALSHHCNVAAPGLALIAEDDTSSRELLRRTLEKDGWKIVEASNGREALDCMRQECPSLILLDLMMPEMDGFEFLDNLRQHPPWQSIPVIVITAKELTEEDHMFLNGSLFLSGCVKRVLQKGSFDRTALLQEVRELVGPLSEASP